MTQSYMLPSGIARPIIDPNTRVGAGCTRLVASHSPHAADIFVTIKAM